VTWSFTACDREGNIGSHLPEVTLGMASVSKILMLITLARRLTTEPGLNTRVLDTASRSID
jgi:hypothetical protein